MSKELAEDIIAMFLDRNGFDNWWDGVDENIQREIMQEILHIIET